jgi:hypothetical protein
MVKFNENKINIDGKDIIFFTEIDDIIDLGDKIIVKVFSTSEFVDYQVKDNIFAINRKGEMLWQIETPYVNALNKLVPQVYLGVKYLNNKLIVGNGGIKSEIDINTGKILSTWQSDGRVTPL